MRVPVLCARRPLRISLEISRYIWYLLTYLYYIIRPSLPSATLSFLSLLWFHIIILLLSASTCMNYDMMGRAAAITGIDGGWRRRTTASRRILGAPLLCRQEPARNVRTISQPPLPYHRAGDGGPDPQGDHSVETANTAAILKALGLYYKNCFYF